MQFSNTSPATARVRQNHRLRGGYHNMSVLMRGGGDIGARTLEDRVIGVRESVFLFG